MLRLVNLSNHTGRARVAAAAGLCLLAYATVQSVAFAHSSYGQPQSAQAAAVVGALLFTFAAAFLAGELLPLSRSPKQVPLTGPTDLKSARTRACLLRGHIIPCASAALTQ